MNNKLVKDYKGNLIFKSKARKFGYQYYEEGVSCFLLEDGQWYKITSDRIRYDHYKKGYTVSIGNLASGIINEQGEKGYFSGNDFSVVLKDSPSTGANTALCLNEQIANALGYIESINDGIFYKKSLLTSEDYKLMNLKSIPQTERSQEYNLESNQEKKNHLIEMLKSINIKISPLARRIARYLGDKTFGMECEVINGHLPKRIRTQFAVKALKDGSLRSDNGEGIEYVTVPLQGAKGVQLMMNLADELTKRCEVNNYCSLHFHFGNVRKDKIYVLSLYRLIRLIQGELIKYFPYSRFNSIKADGKIYCKPLDDLGIDYKKLLQGKNEEDFKKNVVKEFNKFYKWLNHGHALAEEFGDRSIRRETKNINGRRMFRDVWLRNIYTTKSIQHSIQGNKWDKAERYFIYNFLNLFFNNIHTIESRAHEGTTNKTKLLIWFLVNIAILNYAEKIQICFTRTYLTLKEVLESTFPKDLSEYIIEYMNMRHKTFFNSDQEYKTYKSIEERWFKEDSSFKFKFKDYSL